MTHSWIQILGVASSIALPLFNIPLMLRMIQRRSSQDVSLIWVIGIFTCLAGMVPIGWQSTDPIFKIFTIINFVFFSGVAMTAVYFRVRR